MYVRYVHPSLSLDKYSQEDEDGSTIWGEVVWGRYNLTPIDSWRVKNSQGNSSIQLAALDSWLVMAIQPTPILTPRTPPQK